MKSMDHMGSFHGNHRHPAPRWWEPWSILHGFTSIPMDPVDPLENSQRAPMTLKTQYTGPFSRKMAMDSHGNPWSTMEIHGYPSLTMDINT